MEREWAKMSILIKGMAMPTDIVTTLNIFADDRHVSILEKEPIILHDAVVELPDHGDLLDKDELSTLVGESFEYFLARLSLKCPKAVIPAERSKK